MLTKKTIEALAKTVGLDASELANAISDEQEKDLTIDVIKSFTSEEWGKHEEAIDKEKKSKYDNGKRVGSEQVISELKTKVGLDFQGKSEDDFISNFKSKVLDDNDKNPDSRIVELEKDIKTLRDVTLKGEQEKNIQLQAQIDQINTKSKVTKLIPSKLPVGITQGDAETILMSNLEFTKDDEGNEVVKKNGQVLKDEKLRTNVSYETAVTDFVTERNWRSSEPGRGGEGSEGSKHSDYKAIRSMKEMNDYFEANGINPMSDKGQTIIQEAEKSARNSKEEFDFDS